MHNDVMRSAAVVFNHTRIPLSLVHTPSPFMAAACAFCLAQLPTVALVSCLFSDRASSHAKNPPVLIVEKGQRKSKQVSQDNNEDINNKRLENHRATTSVKT